MTQATATASPLASLRPKGSQPVLMLSAAGARNGLVTAGLVKNKNLTCYEHVKFEVESCGGTFIGKDQAVRDGRLVTGQTWQSHPDFYRMVFQCLGT